MNKIQFIDLDAQQKMIYSGLERRIKAVLSHGKYIMGPEVSELEEKLAQYARVKYAISCSNGTDALLMSLMAYGVGPGDAIFTTPFTFIATAEVIALLGATPVFVDIDPITFNIDPNKLDQAITAVNNHDSSIYPLPKAMSNELSAIMPKGIISVDLFGLPADYHRINSIANAEGLFVVEDAAQSFGATYDGKKAGALANVAATSFFPAKPLGCYGDGGAVLTDDDDLAASIKSIRLHGKGKEKYDNVRVGINGRLDTIQAAILLEKLGVFPGEIEARNRIAEKYSRGLDKNIQTPHLPPGSMSAWAQYSVLSNERDSLREALTKAGIPTAIYYPKPLHLQGAFSGLGYKPGDFQVSEETSQKIFSLPMHPYLKNDQIDRIVQVIQATLGNQQ